MRFKASAVSVLLNTLISADRPQLVVVSGTRPRQWVVCCKFFLFSGKHALNGIHWHQVLAVPIIDKAIRLHNASNLVVRLAVEGKEQLKPIFDELIVFLCSNEVILVGQLPLNLRIYCWIDLPFEHSAPIRMEVHHYLWQMTESVEDVFTRELANVDQPIKIGEWSVGDI